VYFLYVNQHQPGVLIAPPRPAAVQQTVQPPVNPLELRQRQAMDEADSKRAAGDLSGAFQMLQNAVSIHGPLTDEVEKKLDEVQSEMNNKNLAQVRRQELQWWQQAMSDVDRGRFEPARKVLDQILQLPEGQGLKREEALKYRNQIIPQRQQEEEWLDKAKQDFFKKDRNSLNEALSLADQIIKLGGPRKPEAERLRQSAQDRLNALDRQQGEQIADLEARAQQDVKQGNISSARQKLGQIKQAGGDTTSLSAEIDRTEEAEQERQQYEANFRQAVQNYNQALAANDKNGLEAARASFLGIVQSGGSHKDDARKYLSEINDRVSTSPVAPPPPPPVAKQEIHSTKALDQAAVRDAIKSYQQAFQQRNVDAVLQIWQNMGNTNYRKLKETFGQLVEFDYQVQIDDIQVSSSGDRATVNGTLLQSSRAKGGEKTKPRKDPVLFGLSKANGKWFITDVK
jgi:ketosteroid isomerase-like protein